MPGDLTLYIPFVLVPIMGWGIRRMLKKKNDYSPLKKATLAIGLSAFFLTEMARSFYRPYIYKHNIFDYYIADTIGNSLGTIAAIFIILTMAGKGNRSDFKLLFIVFTGLIGYECVNPLFNHPLDIRDIFATMIFGSLSFLMYQFLLKKYSGSGMT